MMHDDNKLNTESQLAVAKLVKELPEEQLSMTWRAELNNQIRNEQMKVKKRNKIC